MERPEQGQSETQATEAKVRREAGGGGGETTPPSAGDSEWKAKAAANYDLFLRARADYENLAKRTQRDVTIQLRRGKRDLLLRLLDMADNLERAAGSWRTALAGCSGVDAKSLIEGVEMIGRQLQGILTAEGVRPIEALGKPFDPAEHECVVTWDNPGVDCPTVTDEIKRGYTLDGEVLRPAQVRVAKP